MIKYSKFITLIILVATLSTSCKKWLELKPVDGRVREDYWQTADQLKAAVIGCYVSMASNEMVRYLFTWGELRADMISTTPTTNAEELAYAQANILQTSTLTKWNAIYVVINNCNTIIKYGPGVLAKDPTLSQTQLDAYLAEARAIRALMYFYLVRTFGEAPLKLEPSATDSSIEMLPKSSREELLTQIIADLDFAEPRAAADYGNDPRQTKGRITRYGVNAIQADVYLWMAGSDKADNYNKCIAACDKVINSGAFGLVDGANQLDWYTSVFFNGNSVESIFELQFDSQLLNPFYAILGDPTRKRFTAAPSVMEDVYSVDPTDPINIKDIRGDGGSIRATDNLIWKYMGTTNINAIRALNASFAHWYFYRFADILLLKAEALAWTGKGQDALTLVDQIRTRARALPGTLQAPAVTDAQEVTEYILAERAREFAFEGKRWFDVLRCAKRDNYAHLDLILGIVGTNAGNSKANVILGKYSDVRSHYLPINIDELTADPKLEQNPYYK